MLLNRTKILKMAKRIFTHEQEVDIFKQYLRIPTVQPVKDEDYKKAGEFLKGIGKKVGLEWKCLEFKKGRELVIFTLKGKNSDLKSILLNSHIDVVTVNKEKWERDPFGAEEDGEGRIYARGHLPFFF